MDVKTNRKLARKETPVRAGRGGGPHRDRSKYDRKTQKHWWVRDSKWEC